MATPYEAAIHLSVTGGAAETMAVLISRILGANVEVAKLAKSLEGLKIAAMGAVSAFVGFEMIKGVKNLADHAKELSHEMAQLEKLNQNMTASERNRVREWAGGAPGRVQGVTTAGAYKTYSEIRSLFGEESALKMGDTILRFGQVLGGLTGNWDKVDQQVLKMVRAGDLLGKFTDPATHKTDYDKLQRFLDLGTKVINATGGMISPSTWFGLAQQGGPALSNMTDEGLLAMAMAAQGMGGMRAGTAMTSAYQQVIGGKGTQYAAQKLHDFGLVGDFDVGKGGHLLWHKGALDTPWTRQMQKDPLEATQMLQEAMIKAGYDTIEKQVPVLFEAFGRQTTQRLVHDFLRNYPQMKGERGRLEAGQGVIGAGNVQANQDYMFAMHAFSAAWEDMMAKVGLPAAQAAIPMLKSVGQFFLNLGTWSFKPENADTLKLIAQGITVLGAALMAAGTVAILAALGPVGWIAGGITAIGIAVAAHGQDWKNWLESMRAMNWNTIIAEALEPAILAVKAWFLNLKNAIIEALQGIWQNMKENIGKLFHWTSYEGGGGGGGGMMNASYGGGAGASGAMSAGERAQYASMIRQYGGAEASNLLKIYGTEGAIGYVGDSGSSFGPFQLHKGGPGSAGYDFMRETGLDPADRSTVKAQILWMKEYGRKHGVYSSQVWHGLRDRGVGSLRSSQRKGGDQEAAIHVHTHIDGVQVAHTVAKHATRLAQFPTSAPYFDGSRAFTTPDHGLATT